MENVKDITDIYDKFYLKRIKTICVNKIVIAINRAGPFCGE